MWAVGPAHIPQHPGDEEPGLCFGQGSVLRPLQRMIFRRAWKAFGKSFLWVSEYHKDLVKDLKRNSQNNNHNWTLGLGIPQLSCKLDHREKQCQEPAKNKSRRISKPDILQPPAILAAKSRASWRLLQ